MASDIDLDTNFRFLGLTKEQANVLKESGINCNFGTHFKTKAITGIVPLDSSVIAKIGEFMEQQKISNKDTDIFISFNTEYDTRVIDIPTYVNEAVISLGSKLVVSYTVL
ncbi:hypothetical protein V8687_11210 [Shewanella baltica]|uniref:hypothetical protein n=1 Tax=Shewanella baltica TaxID=62322 RepID=UPI0030D2FF0D